VSKVTNRGSYKASPESQAARSLVFLQKERARHPHRELFAYRVELPTRPKQHALICKPCAHTLEEPARATLISPAPWALSCDWCRCNNVASKAGETKPARISAR
jgi:RecB family exonuclease